MPESPSGPNAQHDRLLTALRMHGTAFSDMGRQLGLSAGLHTTDANALVHILAAQDAGAPLTQTQLSHRVGLTGGATSSLLNRLEDAGHIRRARDNADRRIVTLHSTDGVEELIDGFFDPLAERLGTVMDRYSPEVLAEFERFLSDVAVTMDDYLAEKAAASR
ncbi:hypothetical protein B7R54_11805 [Subtercola boreus]|uniref:HTH marR-type domain-containing protein n=1 Tax=Subtercola boreus TaxID=120213 RepID=A0A3E0VIM7_9MICO|nr:MarR family transcriptional regulator [Subtercola boreus]RFA09814.1 hypothetical protein B7R54_11805 [Subtercola boreus]TQL53068.1 DNA-binding MarR family transcriptional regulator [Subtercola boreus]